MKQSRVNISKCLLKLAAAALAVTIVCSAGVAQAAPAKGKLSSARAFPHREAHTPLPPKQLRSGLPARKPGTPRATAAAASYYFYVSNPSATCTVNMGNSTSSFKSISVKPPKVFAFDGYSQTVYWRALVYGAGSGQLLASPGSWQSATAYRTYIAQFAGPQSWTFSRGNDFTPVGVAVEVWWYSPVYGWHSYDAMSLPIRINVQQWNNYTNSLAAISTSTGTSC